MHGYKENKDMKKESVVTEKTEAYKKSYTLIIAEKMETERNGTTITKQRKGRKKRSEKKETIDITITNYGINNGQYSTRRQKTQENNKEKVSLEPSWRRERGTKSPHTAATPPESLCHGFAGSYIRSIVVIERV